MIWEVGELSAKYALAIGTMGLGLVFHLRGSPRQPPGWIRSRDPERADNEAPVGG